MVPIQEFLEWHVCGFPAHAGIEQQAPGAVASDCPHRHPLIRLEANPGTGR